MSRSTLLAAALLAVLLLGCEAWMPSPFVRTAHNRLFSTTATDSITISSRDERVQEVLQLARELGPVGTRRSKEEQQKILDAALALKDLSDRPAPAKIKLSGIHDLLYSAAPGGSSGKLGPFDGKVTQEFIDDTTFINAVELGPIKFALTATRDIKNDTTIAVKFLKTRVSLFGKQIAEKDVGGGGSWKMLFAGKITDADGSKKLVRILQTPSLFVIAQPVD